MRSSAEGGRQRGHPCEGLLSKRVEAIQTTPLQIDHVHCIFKEIQMHNQPWPGSRQSKKGKISHRNISIHQTTPALFSKSNPGLDRTVSSDGNRVLTTTRSPHHLDPGVGGILLLTASGHYLNHTYPSARTCRELPSKKQNAQRKGAWGEDSCTEQSTHEGFLLLLRGLCLGRLDCLLIYGTFGDCLLRWLLRGPPCLNCLRCFSHYLLWITPCLWTLCMR